MTVEERDVLSSDPVSVKSYQGVAIEEGDVFSLDASAQDAPTDCVLVDDSDWRRGEGFLRRVGLGLGRSDGVRFRGR